MKTIAWKQLVLAGGAMAMGMLAPGARADVVTYDNGKVLRGIVEDIPGDPANVNITTADRKLRIPKSRISNLQRESAAMSHIQIGRDYRAKKQYPKAIQEFQRALDAEPGNEEALKEINATQAMMSETQTVVREEAVKQVEGLMTDARTQTDKRQFEQAEKTLRSAADLVPTEEQKPRLQLQISDMYYAWAEDRIDKLDKVGAEEKLNLALEANPKNTQVIDKLLTLWKDNPDKQEDTAAVYETVLDHQKDNATLRKELGDLYFKMRRYDDAARHYIELYTQGEDQYKGTSTESNLIVALRELHLKEAREQNYDMAIFHYNILAKLDPETDPGAVVYYEFLKRSAAIPKDDLEGQIALGDFAEKNGLDAEAIAIYNTLTQFEATRGAANAGLERYALLALKGADEQMRSGNFQLAQAMADQLIVDYPNATQAVEEAKKIIGTASVELRRMQKQKGEMAKELLVRGDEFYERGMYFYQSLYDTERRSSPGLGSMRSEAKRYFMLAVGAYNEAIRADSSLATDSTSIVMVRLADAQDKIRRLSSKPRAFGNYAAPGSN